MVARARQMLVHSQLSTNIKLVSQESKGFSDLIDETAKNFLEQVKEISLDNFLISTDKSELDNLAEDIELLTLKVTSDIQYDLEDNTFVAEGNAKISVSGGILIADRIEFSRNNKKLTAKGNVSFEKGNQYFRAGRFNYSFTERKGELIDAYGVLNVRSLNQDFNFPSDPNIEDRVLINNKLYLNEGYEINFPNLKSNINNINSNIDIDNKINSWRFQSASIIILQDTWESEEINFTNDPFNPIQFSIKAKDVIASKKDNVFVLTSNKTRLIFDRRLTIPIGEKTFYSEKQDQENKWKLGFDSKDRQGIYISRSLDDIDFGPNNIKLSLSPQFLIQRSIISDPNFSSDSFGLIADIKGSELGWDFIINNNFSTLQFDQIDQGYRFSADFKRELSLPKIKDMSLNIFSAYRYLAWNGTLGETEINSANGAFLEKNGQFNYRDIKNSYNVRLGAAEYYSEELNSNQLASNFRSSFFGSIASEYQIWRDSSKVSDESIYEYLPDVIDSNISFKTYISLGLFKYSNGDSQSFIMLSAGPELRLGKLKRRFLDYTKFSVMPAIKIKSGQSPFKFDNSIDLKSINFSIKQQLYGPIILSTDFALNIDSFSSNYGKMFGTKMGILLKKRAYELGLAYNPDNGGGGIFFRLNGFNFDKSKVNLF